METGKQRPMQSGGLRRFQNSKSCGKVTVAWIDPGEVV
jgi:hypothetical protein